ncbi:hypothetical protein ACWC4E_00005, partial [Streptomyces sp. NPDC001273]
IGLGLGRAIPGLGDALAKVEIGGISLPIAIGLPGSPRQEDGADPFRGNRPRGRADRAPNTARASPNSGRAARRKTVPSRLFPLFPAPHCVAMAAPGSP